MIFLNSLTHLAFSLRKRISNQEKRRTCIAMSNALHTIERNDLEPSHLSRWFLHSCRPIRGIAIIASCTPQRNNGHERTQRLHNLTGQCWLPCWRNGTQDFLPLICHKVVLSCFRSIYFKLRHWRYPLHLFSDFHHWCILYWRKTPFIFPLFNSSQTVMIRFFPLPTKCWLYLEI